MATTSIKLGSGALLAILLLAGFGIFVSAPDGSDDGAFEQASPEAAIFDTLISRSQEAAFEQLSGPWTLSLPEDHSGHSAARSETWGLLVHLGDETSPPIGLQFSMTRLGLIPENGDAKSATDRAVYRAHAILTDASTGQVIAEERLSRDLGAAGHDPGNVWLDDWHYSIDRESGALTLVLSFREAELPVSLAFSPEKPASQSTAEQGIRGYSIPRLTVSGHIGDKAVNGLASLTHFWGDVPLPGGATASDILSLQLSDDTDLSLIRTVRRDGRGPAVLDGAVSMPGGETQPIDDGRYSVAPSEDGSSDQVVWIISGPNLELEATSLLAEDHDAFAFNFSSALLKVTGTKNGQSVEGLGTLQRNGYEEQ